MSISTGFAPRGQGAARQPSVHSDKEVGGHYEADADYDAADFPGVQFLRVMRAEPTSSQRTGDHYRALRPQDRMRGDKGDYGSGVDGGAEERPDRAHGMNVLHPEDRQHSKSHESDSCAEVSAVDGNEQFGDRTDHDRLPRCVPQIVIDPGARSPAEDAAERVAEGEQQRATEQQPGNKPQKSVLRGFEQEQRSGPTPENARHQ